MYQVIFETKPLNSDLNPLYFFYFKSHQVNHNYISNDDLFVNLKTPLKIFNSFHHWVEHYFNLTASTELTEDSSFILLCSAANIFPKHSYSLETVCSSHPEIVLTTLKLHCRAKGGLQISSNQIFLDIFCNQSAEGKKELHFLIHAILAVSRTGSATITQYVILMTSI